MTGQIIIDGRTMPLARDRYLIGRGEGCDILLPEADMSVSRRHAMLERGAAGEWNLLDISSRNGTLVNNQRVADRHTLHDGDTIRIGGSEIKLLLPRSMPTVFMPAPAASADIALAPDVPPSHAPLFAVPVSVPAPPDGANGMLGPVSMPPPAALSGAMAYDIPPSEMATLPAAYSDVAEPASAASRPPDVVRSPTASLPAAPLPAAPLSDIQPSALPLYAPPAAPNAAHGQALAVSSTPYAPPAPVYAPAPSAYSNNAPRFANAPPVIVDANAPVAGVGLRLCAYLIDFLISLPLHWLAAIPIIGFVFAPLVCFYWLSRDAIFGGQSVGKKVMNLRVARLNGEPFTWGHSVLRNFTAFILLFQMIPFIGILAFLAMFPLTFVDVLVILCTGRRIGDHLAGTRVVSSL